MKQAWGWLFAGVLAAGLNAGYHDGGLQWAHRAAERAGYNVEAVLALATGHADQFLAAARMATAQDGTSSCRVATALAQVQTRIASRQTEFARWETMSARQEAKMAELEANRARIEAQVARLRIPAAAINPVVFTVPVCPRVSVHVPRVKIPAIPAIPVEARVSSGPV